MITGNDIRRRHKNPCLKCPKAETERPAYECKKNCGKWKGYDFCVWRDLKKFNKYYISEIAEIEHKNRIQKRWRRKQ